MVFSCAILFAAVVFFTPDVAPPALFSPSFSAPRRDTRPPGSSDKTDSGLLEIGVNPHLAVTASTAVGGSDAPRELKIVSYNMRWRGGAELRELIALLCADAEIGGASIIGLQEVDRNKKRTGFINTAQVMAADLDMNYVWAAPPRARPDQAEDETGVAILSRYPLSDATRIVLPHEGPGRRRRVALGASVRVGASDLRVYSVHAETRIKMERKMEQLGAVLEDLARYPKISGAVVLGDFNTIKQKDVTGARQLFAAANFVTPFPDDRATWKTFIFELKLDWIWMRGLQPLTSGITRRIGLSDHWPLWVQVKL